MWNETTPEVRQLYGRDYFLRILKGYTECCSQIDPTLDTGKAVQPVIESIKDDF